jgi:hypothetical protein
MLAAAGAVGGLGQGIEQVGQQTMKADMEATHDRLRANLELQNQQTIQKAGFTQQDKEMQAKLAAASAAAGLTRQHETSENALNRASRESIGAGHDLSREDAAAIHAAAGAGGRGSGIKPLQSVTQSVYPMDPKTGKPDFTATPHQVRLTYDSNTGNHYAQMGDTYYRANSQTGEPMDGRTGQPLKPGSTNRASDPATLRALYATPYAIVPAGHANSGLTYAESYEKEYGGLPSQFFANVNKLSQSQNSAAGTSIRLPSGRMYQLPAGGGTGLGANDDTSSDLQNQQDNQQDAPAFQSNAGSSYGNVAND